MTPYPLGRKVQHDARSRNFALDSLPLVARAKVVSKQWDNHSGVLNQGNLGACVGFSSTAALASTPNFELSGLTVDTDFEGLALRTYAQATILDEFQGQYPPDDTGSSGLGGAKALQKSGYISAYTHAFSFKALLGALQFGPVITGTKWYEGMFSPSRAGEVKISGEVSGGHEWMIFGVDVEKKRILAQNSWGEDWGQYGCFWLTYATMERLLGEEGDVTQFVPNLRLPDPPNVETHTDQDYELWVAMQDWARRKGMIA